MAESNALIAALRGATPAPLRQAQGPQALYYPWMSRSEGPLVMPTRDTPSTQTPPNEEVVVAPPPSFDSSSQEPVYIAPTETNIGVYGIPNQPVQQTDWDKLNADYANQYNQAMQGGMTDEQWAQTPVFENWKQTVLDSVRKTTDQNKLQSDIDWFRKTGFDDPVYGDWWKQVMNEQENRLKQLSELYDSYNFDYNFDGTIY